MAPVVFQPNIASVVQAEDVYQPGLPHKRHPLRGTHVEWLYFVFCLKRRFHNSLNFMPTLRRSRYTSAVMLLSTSRILCRPTSRRRSLHIKPTKPGLQEQQPMLTHMSSTIPCSQGPGYMSDPAAIGDFWGGNTERVGWCELANVCGGGGAPAMV